MNEWRKFSAQVKSRCCLNDTLKKERTKKNRGVDLHPFFSALGCFWKDSTMCAMYTVSNFALIFVSFHLAHFHRIRMKRKKMWGWTDPFAYRYFTPRYTISALRLMKKKIRRIWKMNWTEIIVCCFHLFYNVRWLGWNVSFFKFLIKLFLIFRNCALRPRKMQMRRYSLLLLSMLAIFRFMCLTIPHNLAVNRMLLHRPLSISTPLLLWLQRV